MARSVLVVDDEPNIVVSLEFLMDQVRDLLLQGLERRIAVGRDAHLEPGLFHQEL